MSLIKWVNGMNLSGSGTSPTIIRIISLATFILTVAIDLTVAVEVGLALAFLFFATRISSLTYLEPIPEIEAGGHARIGGDIEAYRIFGSLFFGSVHRLEELIDPGRYMPKIVILSFSNLLNMDTSGLETLANVHETLNKKGCRLLISGAHDQPLSMMIRGGFEEASW